MTARTTLGTSGGSSLGRQRTQAVSIVEEVDDYERSVRGIQIEAVRTGRGLGPNIVRTTHGDDFVATSVQTQFPMVGRTTISDELVIPVAITSAPPGSNWCGIDLEPGNVLIYGPGAEHTAINPAGIGFSFAAVPHNELASAANDLGLPYRPPSRGQVHALAPSPAVEALASCLSSLMDAAMAGVTPQQNGSRILHRLAAALSEDRRSWRVGARKRIDSRHVANTCIRYAEAVERIPTIRELCLVAHVSERRLRTAFNDVYGMPPARFFRIWGLDAAHRRLRAADGGEATVTDVALDIGFGHLGKFAGRYKRLYGESPSATLAAATGAGRLPSR